jgi:heme/copper-type cytochrome/quinol oxidase subunit 4
MSGAAGYVVVWIVLSFFPIMTAWKRQWFAFAVYLAGWLFFLYSVLQDKGGWGQLADIATLIVIVIPLYLISSIIWLISKRKNKHTRR